MRDRADLVIVGGGVIGLSLAYHLARLGFSDVVVLEQGYLCFGASGRNGGGVRQQWSTEENVLLMKDAVRRYRRLSQECGYNIWFRQGGYLFLARDDASAATLEQNTKLQNRLGVPTRLISPAEARRIVPVLNLEGVRVCAYNPTDGVLFPFPVVWGMARIASDLGVEINTFTRVTNIDVRGRQIVKVVTDRGAIATRRVVNAAGAWSPQVARLAGVELPNKPYRHEILVSEPVKPFLDPLVSDLSNGTYFSQTMRGEICGGLSDPAEPSSMESGSSLRFLSRMSRSLMRLVPQLGSLKVLRQWAGYYDETPDGQPILGRVDAVDGFIQLNGFGGHGFMMAPAIGQLAAEWILRKAEHPIFSTCDLGRFARGEQRRETFSIG
ncbi:MAG: FAD-binding oxidoreductase [Myxococcales bacterium]|nr:FAD-binding oxidoreductase [Myxococcales bacterium]